MRFRRPFPAVVAPRYGQRGPDGAWRLVALMLRGILPMLLLLLGAQPARAICLRGPTPALVALGDMVGRDPQRALDLATARLSAERQHLSRTDIAWLHAIRADAYDNLSLPDAARGAAVEGMKVMPDIRDPAHVELLTEYAYNGFDTAQIDQSMPLVRRAWAAQTPGSAAAVCMQATLGHLQRMRGLAGPAVVNMMQAYRASMRPELGEQRIYVAAAFSILMRYAGDWNQALALNQEGIDWSIAKGRTHDLADFRYKGAWIMINQGNYEPALNQLRLARELRKGFGDVVNDAYIDLVTCDVLVRLGRFAPARVDCRNAEAIFAAHGDASRGQARLLLAQIALGQHRPRDALALLATLFREGDAESASVNRAKLYLYRAKAFAAVGRAVEAYADMNSYVELAKRWSETDGARQAAFLRARFSTDRQIDQNRALQAALGFAEERDREQRHRTTILLISGSIFIVLLGYIVLADRRNRRRLLLVASSDGLTGLLNRKWTADRGAATLAHALRQDKPVSVALIDLDHFKRINDTHGHAAGDEVLRQFAEAARAVIRNSDVLGRWGGEEFLLVMPDTVATDACEVVERLRTRATGVKLSFDDNSGIRFSAGITDCTTEHTLDELVGQADVALYRAKDRGRDVTCVYRGTEDAGHPGAPSSRKAAA